MKKWLTTDDNIKELKQGVLEGIFFQIRSQSETFAIVQDKL